jgi:hypothetical protein
VPSGDPFLGKSGVALLYLRVGEESRRQRGLLTEADADDEADDLNQINFESKGTRGQFLKLS